MISMFKNPKKKDSFVSGLGHKLHSFTPESTGLFVARTMWYLIDPSNRLIGRGGDMSALMKKHNVRIFKTVKEALTAEFEIVE